MALSYERGFLQFISYNNKLSSTLPTVSGIPRPGEDYNDIIKYDHSTFITRAGGFTVEFGAVSGVNYIFISGHTIYNYNDGEGAGNVFVYDQDEIIAYQNVTEPKNIFIIFPTTDFTNLRVVMSNMLIGSPTPPDMKVSLIAGGQCAFILSPYAGYEYLSQGSAMESETSLNGMAAPVTTRLKHRQLAGSWKYLHADTYMMSQLKDIIKMSESGVLFMRETNSSTCSGVMLYDIETKVTAHPQSSKLWDFSMTFKGFAGYYDGSFR